MSRFFIRYVSRRGAFLLFLATLDYVYALALAFPTPDVAHTPTYVFLSNILNLDVWAILWTVAGTFCLFYAFRRKDAPGFAAAMFIKVLWALIFLMGWLFAGIQRGFLAAVIWGAFAAVCLLIATWPDEARATK